MEYEHRARPLWPRSLSIRLIETDARFRRPPQQSPPLLRVGYHVDQRCHLSPVAFDSTMSCSTHPVQYRVSRCLGSPVSSTEDRKRKRYRSTSQSGTQNAFPSTYTIPRNITRQGKLNENKTKEALRFHLFRPELPAIAARWHGPSAIMQPHLLET